MGQTGGKVGPEAEAAFLKVTDQLTQTGQIKPEKHGTTTQLLMMQRNSKDGTPLLGPLVQLSLRDPQKVASILLQIKENVTKSASSALAPYVIQRGIPASNRSTQGTR